MSDPQPPPGRKQPRRAEPLQPDLPGGGGDAESKVPPVKPSTVAKQKAQSKDALDNVRKGYG